MAGKFLSLLAIALLSSALSCKKEEEIMESDCMELQSGITNSNIEQIKTVITRLINSLPSQDYTEGNQNKLVSVIGEQCSTPVSVLCFDSIQTLPSQTEIRISHGGTNNPANKIVDITYTANNKMKFSNLHD